ncbi:MAG: regulatory protein RecX [Candidatus Gracilibacteria bacterium]|nr:regulatory protein RecX [Candidatus Gracilibacteria bacterium]
MNDSQYAKDYISDRIRFKPRSKFLLKRELSLKGISPEVSAEILDDSGADEFEMAIQLLRKRGFFDSENLSQKEQAKYCRFLASKGFNKEIIYKSLKSQYNCD